MTCSAKLKALGIQLSEAPKAVANYVPFVISGNHVYISGQLPLKDGIPLHNGKLGQTVTLEEGKEAARQCAINIITQLQTACEGDLGRVEQCVRLGGFVNSTPDFTDHPKVVNGASDLIVDVFGELGRHARAAVGVSSLPLGVCVEIEAVFRITS